MYAIIGRQQKISNECSHLSDLSDKEIYQTTRFPRIAVEQLHDMLRGDIEHPTARSNAVQPKLSCLQLCSFSQLVASSGWLVGAVGYRNLL